MKNIFFGLAIATITFTACNGGNKSTKTNEANRDLTSVNLQKTTDTTTINIYPAKETIAAYLQLKNALTKDNSDDAATAGKAIVASLNKIEQSSLSANEQKIYADLSDDIKENAEHIAANAGKIAHQREHFEMLSKDITDLIKTFSTHGQIFYKDFCPMFNNGKGAYWISEIKEIKNPYLGTHMLTCGSVKEILK